VAGGFEDDDDDAIELGSSAFMLPADHGKHSKPPPTPQDHDPDHEPMRRRGVVLPWLLFLLTAAVLAMLAIYSADERARMKTALSSARDEAAENRRTMFSAQEKLVSVERDLAGKSDTLAAMQNALAQKGQESDDNAKLIAELRSKVDAKDGEVSQESNRVAVNLVDEILFKSGDAELSPRGKELLTKLGAVLKGHTDKQIVIGGHTDDAPIHTERFPSNWELSSARAVNVVHHLVDAAGIDGRRLSAAAYSEFHPRGKVRAKNRRIEILLTPLVDIKAK
jgi:chemotaxis protein MotB